MLISNTNPSHTYPKKLLLEQTHNELKIGFKFHSLHPLPSSRSHSFTHEHTHTHTLSLSLSLSQHACTHSPSLFFSRTHADLQFILFSLSFSLFLYHLHSRTLTQSLFTFSLFVCLYVPAIELQLYWVRHHGVHRVVNFGKKYNWL